MLRAPHEHAPLREKNGASGGTLRASTITYLSFGCLCTHSALFRACQVEVASLAPTAVRVARPVCAPEARARWHASRVHPLTGDCPLHPTAPPLAAVHRAARCLTRH
eukprot:5573881-Pleurochrysis_carterae.AAC.2